MAQVESWHTSLRCKTCWQEKNSQREGDDKKSMQEGAAGRTFKRRCTEGSRAAAAGERSSAWSF